MGLLKFIRKFRVHITACLIALGGSIFAWQGTRVDHAVAIAKAASSRIQIVENSSDVKLWYCIVKDTQTGKEYLAIYRHGIMELGE